jgi:hypothetical protein
MAYPIKFRDFYYAISLVLESSKPKTLTPYSQDFQDLVQTTISAISQKSNIGDQVALQRLG